MGSRIRLSPWPSVCLLLLRLSAVAAPFVAVLDTDLIMSTRADADADGLPGDGLDTCVDVVDNDEDDGETWWITRSVGMVALLVLAASLIFVPSRSVFDIDRIFALVDDGV